MKQNKENTKSIEDDALVSDDAPDDLFDEGFYYNEDEEKKKKDSANKSNMDIADISRKTLRLVNEAQRDWLTTGRRYAD